MPNTEEKDKDKLYFYGESSKLRTFEKHVEDVVAKVGGEVLVDHLHNRQSEDIVRRKAAEQFELDKDDDGKDLIPDDFPAWDDMNDVPEEWIEYAEGYVLGAIDLKDPLKSRTMSLEHYQANFVVKLARDRDQAIWNHVNPLLRGNAALLTRQLTRGCGRSHIGFGT